MVSVTLSREQHARELVRERGAEIHAVEPGVYEVPASNGIDFYRVTYGTGELETCTCWDFKRRGVNCKHILAVAIAHTTRRGACPHCLDADWVLMGAENDQGEYEEYAVLCRRCKGRVSRI